MSNTIYATFLDPEHGKKAAGALLDHGALKEDLSLLVGEAYATKNPNYWQSEVVEVKNDDAGVKNGVTTTTGADAGAGATKGGIAGLVLGIVGALAALAIPGFGLVIGGGALATAVGAAVGTTAAGAIAGGVTGYLKDQGVPDEHAATYDAALREGGAMLAVQSPSGKLGDTDIRALLDKYGANRAESYPLAIR